MRAGRQQGFSMLELIVVVVIIGVLAAGGIKYYLSALDKAHAVTVEMTAWRFGHTASVIRAWSRIPPAVEDHRHGTDRRGIRWVSLDGSRVYLNENDWPANADAMESPSLGDQTAQECEQLMNAILASPVVDLRQHADSPSSDYIASTVDGRTCRYQLSQNKDEPWFFDYSLETGKVQVSVPRLRIERYADN